MNNSDSAAITINDGIDLSPRERSILDFIWRTTMNTLGFLLIGFFTILYYFLVQSFIYDNVLLYHLYCQNTFITITLLLIGLWIGTKMFKYLLLAFNIMFNYALAVLINPGNTKTFFIKHGQQQSKDFAPFIYDPT